MTVGDPGAVRVRRATVADLDALVDTLVVSHHDYVWEAWALPGPSDARARVLAALYRADLALLGLPFGAVWTTDHHEAVAVWLPAGASARLDAPSRLELERVAVSCFGTRLEIVGRVDAAVAGVRPPADWHLATMGTHPSRQRQGLGTAVLLPMLDGLDAARESATLETSEPGNLAFYGRLGFRIVATVPATDDVPPVWIMRREPRAAPASCPA